MTNRNPPARLDGHARKVTQPPMRGTGVFPRGLVILLRCHGLEGHGSGRHGLEGIVAEIAHPGRGCGGDPLVAGSPARTRPSLPDPIEQGTRARIHGHPKDACPYPRDSEKRTSWMEGCDGTPREDEADRPSGERCRRASH